MTTTTSNTSWAGIVVRTDDDADSKLFLGKVTAALDKINSKPVGKALLDTIAGEIGKARNGFTVMITPNASVKKTFGPLIRWRTYSKGSNTRAGSDQGASDGTGVISRIKWDPSTTDTPDGARPPFIGLAHELIHCMYNLLGTSHLIGGDDELKVDEMRVTGLQGYEQEAISENRIRKEHGIAYRVSYHGKCSKAEGKPDKSKFV